MEAPPVNQVFVVQPAETIEGVMGAAPEAPTANEVVPRVPAPGEFRALFELYFRYVWHTLARLGVPARDLEDVTHDVFLEIHRHLSEFDPTRSLRPWIFAFAFRVGSHYRRRARHRYETLGDAEAFDGAPSALERVLTSETLEVAHAALGAIEVERRAVLLLHDVQRVLDAGGGRGPRRTTQHRVLAPAARPEGISGTRGPAAAPPGGSVTPEVEGLPELGALRDECARSPDGATADRVFARLRTHLVAAAVAPEPRPQTLTDQRPANTPEVLRPTSGLAGILLRGPTLALSAAFLLGGATGVALHAALARSSAPRVVYADRPSPGSRMRSEPMLENQPSPRPPGLRGALPTPIPSVEATPPPARARRPRPAVAAARKVAGSSLAEEQVVLDRARAALGSEDFGSALQLTRVHAAQFGASVLEEEREAIAIKALAGAHQDAVARARLEQFEQRFPRSPSLASLRRAVTKIP